MSPRLSGVGPNCGVAHPHLLLVGADYALGPALTDLVGENADIVILPTAAAFTGMAESAIAILEVVGPQHPEALLVGDREAAQTEHIAQRVREAAAVIVTDGSPLHFRTTVRDTLLHEALRHTSLVVAVGAVGTALGATMVDPRGGAPTTGLGLFSDVVVAVSAATLSRTRELLGSNERLLEVTPTSAWLSHDGEWREI